MLRGSLLDRGFPAGYPHPKKQTSGTEVPPDALKVWFTAE